MSYGLAVSPRFKSVTLAAGDTVIDLGAPDPFPVLLATEIVVRRVRAGATTVLALDVDYAVSLLDQLPGARVTLAAPALAGDVVEVIGARPIARPNDLADGNKFSDRSFNAEFDRLVIQDQEQRRDIGRAVKAGYGVEGPTLASIPEGDTLMMGPGNTIVRGPDAADILAAGPNAAAAAASALAAAVSAQIAADAAATVGQMDLAGAVDHDMIVFNQATGKFERRTPAQVKPLLNIQEGDLSTFAKVDDTATVNGATVGTVKLPDGRWLVAYANHMVNAPLVIQRVDFSGRTPVLVPYQTITGNGVNLFGRISDVKFHITTDDHVVLVASDYRNTANTQYEANSVVFRFDAALNAGAGGFAFLQNVATRGARRVKMRRVDTTDYLFIASEVSNTVNEKPAGSPYANCFRQKLTILTWNPATDVFDFYQDKTNLRGVREADILKAGADLYVAAAQYYDDDGTGASSPGNMNKTDIFKFVSSVTKFDAWKQVEVKGNVCVEAFEYGTRKFFALGFEIGGEFFDQLSPIYEITAGGDLVFVCSVPTRGCTRIVSKLWNGMLLLGYVNAVTGHNAQSTFDSSALDLFRFDGMQARPLSISIPSFGLYDAQFIDNGGRLYVALAESYSTRTGSSNIDSRLVDLGPLAVVQSVPAAPRLLMPGAVIAAGKLTVLSLTQLQFQRNNGSWIWVHGNWLEIPRAGIIIPNNGLAANTAYRVFIKEGTSGEPVGEINTRTAFLQPTNGIWVDDQTLQKTYIGNLTTNNNAQFTAVTSFF